MSEKKRRAAVNTATSIRKKRAKNRVVLDDEINSDYTNSQMGKSSNPDLDSPPRRSPDLDSSSDSSPRRSPEELLALLDADKNMEYYLNAAFRSMRKNEVFMFLEHDYFVIKYDPETPKNDCLVKGPLLVCDGFPSLYASPFNENGIDAAFGCHGVNEAFFFSGTDCAKIRYDLDTRTGDLIKVKGKGLIPTLKMFPFLGERVAVNAAFESTVIDQAYLFQGSRYVLINYSKRKLKNLGLITDAFPCLRDTIFSSDIGAAFASHKSNQVYLFKDNSYVLIHYNPRETDDSYIIDGPGEIVPTNWPSLRDIVPYNEWGRGDIEPKTWTPGWSNGHWFRVE